MEIWASDSQPAGLNSFNALQPSHQLMQLLGIMGAPEPGEGRTGCKEHKSSSEPRGAAEGSVGAPNAGGGLKSAYLTFMKTIKIPLAVCLM